LTCYFRHMSAVFEKAGIEVTPENKKQLDQIIHNLAKTNYKNCPSTWREIKKLITSNEGDFAEKLKTAWANQQTGER
jgi:hypothetical protein